MNNIHMLTLRCEAAGRGEVACVSAIVQVTKAGEDLQRRVVLAGEKPDVPVSWRPEKFGNGEEDGNGGADEEAAE